MPGEGNLDIVEALSRSTIKLVVTRHEQAAAFMAATHGRLTGKAGVCLSTLGPGEGQVNRLKTLKRAMYGRAGVELLRARMLPFQPSSEHAV